MDKNQTLQKINAVIRASLPKTYKIVLFGSWAKGNALETSDLDIGILGQSPIPWETLVHIREEIASLRTLRKIDVVDLKRVDKTFRKSALSYAKKLE